MQILHHETSPTRIVETNGRVRVMEVSSMSRAQAGLRRIGATCRMARYGVVCRGGGDGGV